MSLSVLTSCLKVYISDQECTVIQFINELIQLGDGCLAPNEWSYHVAV